MHLAIAMLFLGLCRPFVLRAILLCIESFQGIRIRTRIDPDQPTRTTKDITERISMPISLGNNIHFVMMAKCTRQVAGHH